MDNRESEVIDDERDDEEQDNDMLKERDDGLER